MNSGGNGLGVQLGCSPSVRPGPCAPREILRGGHRGPKQGRGLWSHAGQAQMGTQAPCFCPDLSLLFFFFLILKFLTSGITNQRAETNLKGECFSFWNHS